MREREDALVHGLLSGVIVFRWLAWGWLVVVLVLSRPELAQPEARPEVAYVLAGLALAVTVAATQLRRRHPEGLLARRFVVLEVGTAFLLMVGDQLVYQGVARPQWLGSAWPLAGIMTAGIAFGRRGGLLAGMVVGLGRVGAHVIDPDFSWEDRGSLVAAGSTVVLYALAGGVAGFVTAKLRDAERRIGSAQAREEVARTLHDGVLQTLAVVQRRSEDNDIRRLAHEQERELREFLFGSPSTVGGGGDLGARLRAAAAVFEDRYQASARVVMAPDLPRLDPTSTDALAGAVAEALNNAGKHAGAGTVTVFVEPVEDGVDPVVDAGPDADAPAPVASGGGDVVFCSVKDDGRGFDVATTVEGVGLGSSVRGRIEEVGGRVEITSRSGRGTEVRLLVPVQA